MKCLRKVLNICWQDHITNHDIATRTLRREEYIVNVVRRRQHTWLGHLLRMDGNRLPKMRLQAHAHRKRYRGRPRQSWIDEALEGSGLDIKTAVHKAHDREEWRSCIRGAYDQQVIAYKKKTKKYSLLCLKLPYMAANCTLSPTLTLT